MEGVDVWGRSPYGGGISEEDVKLRVLKTGDSMTGNLVMNGNHVTGLPLNISQIIDWSEAPSYKVVQNKVSEMIIDKVDKTGDIMTGSLTLNIGEDAVRYLGCNDLIVGKGFMLLLGSYQNSIQFELQETTPQPIKMLSNNGFLVQLNNNDIIRFGTNEANKQILVYQKIKLLRGLDANITPISNLPEPINDSDAATKKYVNNRLCHGGVVPSLEANTSKTGFYVVASSEYDARYPAHNVFKLMEGAEWATAAVTTNFWIKVYIPAPIRIWKFVLAGRNNAPERIYDWKLEGSTDNVNWTALYTVNNTYIGVNQLTFNVNTSAYYQYYRIFVVNSEGPNPGLRYFQLYKYLV